MDDLYLNVFNDWKNAENTYSTLMNYKRLWIWMSVTPEHEEEFEKAVKEDKKKRSKCSLFNIIDTKRGSKKKQ